MRNTYVELSEFFAPLLALFARPSACFLGVVLVAMTLSSFLFPGYGYSQEIIARSDELEEKIVRCDERVVCSTQEWEEIEELAEKTEGDVKRVRKVRESEQKAELEVLDFYLETCGRSELERDQKSRCRSGFWSGVNLGGIETIAENEGEEKAEQLRKVREALEPKESELSVATSLDIQAFGNLADDVIAQMGADLFLREELRATGPEPTLLVTPITNRSNANIDTPIVNDTLQVRLYEANQFTLVNWNPLAEKTLLQEQYPIPSVDLLADSHNVTRLGQLAGVQYVLNGSIAAKKSDEGDDIVHTLTLTVTNTRSGLDVWTGTGEARQILGGGSLFQHGLEPLNGR